MTTWVICTPYTRKLYYTYVYLSYRKLDIDSVACRFSVVGKFKVSFVLENSVQVCTCMVHHESGVEVLCVALYIGWNLFSPVRYHFPKARLLNKLYIIIVQPIKGRGYPQRSNIVQFLFCRNYRGQWFSPIYERARMWKSYYL